MTGPGFRTVSETVVKLPKDWDLRVG